MAVPADAPSMAYAFGLGLVGVANPCGFPLLPAYLSLFLGEPAARTPDAPATEPTRHGSGERSRRWESGPPLRALRASACVTAGFVVCFGALGLGLGGIVTAVEGLVPWAMVAIGAVMAAVGAGAMAGRHVAMPTGRLQPGRLGRDSVSMVVFGAVYAMASLGCSLPVFLLAVGGGLSRAGFAVVTLSALSYALGMGVLLAVMAFAACSLRRSLVVRLRKASRFLAPSVGFLLVASGAYLSYSWAMTLAHPGATPAIVAAVDRVQGEVSRILSSYARWLGAALGAMVVAVVVASGLERPTGSGASPEKSRRTAN